MKIRTMAVVIIFAFCISCAAKMYPPFDRGQQRQDQNESIQLIEENREMKRGVAEITYRLEAKGFSVGDALELWTKEGTRHELLGVIAIDEQGKARWKSKTGTGHQYSLANLLVKGINIIAGRKDADIVRIILVGNALGKGIEVAVYDETSGQVAFGKIPHPPSDGMRP